MLCISRIVDSRCFFLHPMDITEVHAATEGLTKVQARELALAAKLVLNLFLLCSSARISSIYQALGGFI